MQLFLRRCCYFQVFTLVFLFSHLFASKQIRYHEYLSLVMGNFLVLGFTFLALEELSRSTTYCQVLHCDFSLGPSVSHSCLFFLSLLHLCIPSLILTTPYDSAPLEPLKGPLYFYSHKCLGHSYLSSHHDAVEFTTFFKSLENP